MRCQPPSRSGLSSRKGEESCRNSTIKTNFFYVSCCVLFFYPLPFPWRRLAGCGGEGSRGCGSCVGGGRVLAAGYHVWSAFEGLPPLRSLAWLIISPPRIPRRRGSPLACQLIIHHHVMLKTRDAVLGNAAACCPGEVVR